MVEIIEVDFKTKEIKSKTKGVRVPSHSMQELKYTYVDVEKATPKKEELESTMPPYWDYPYETTINLGIWHEDE